MRTELYPEIEIYKEHRIPVSPLHTIYVEESGNPLGNPVVVLHGGPGGASSPGESSIFRPRVLSYHPIRSTWMWEKYTICVFRRKHDA